MKNLMEEMLEDFKKDFETQLKAQGETETTVRNEKGKNGDISIEEKEDLTSIENRVSTLKEIIIKIKQKVFCNNFVKKILASKDEIPQTMAKMVENGDYHKIVKDTIDGKNYGQSKLKNAMNSDEYFDKDFFTKIGFSNKEIDKVEKLVNDIKPSNAKETIEAMKKIQPDNPKYQKMVEISERGINRLGDNYTTVNPETVKWVMNPINYYANVPKAYFNNPDPKIATTRKVTAVAGSVSILIGIIYIFNLITKILLFLKKKKAF